MVFVVDSQLGEARECFDCEDGHRQAAKINSKQQKKSGMNFTMALVLGYLIGISDVGFILEGLGLEPATKQHSDVPPNTISFDLDCIGSLRQAKHGSFEDCELTDHGDKTRFSQARSQKEKDDSTWALQFMPSMGKAAVNPSTSDSNSAAKAIGEDDAKDGEDAVTTKKKPLKVVRAAAVAAAVFTPAASMAQGAAQLVDYSKEGISIFNNMRTPAALVAGACLSLAFAVPTSDKDTKRIRFWKRVNVLMGFASITSQLIAVIFSTNAINRLTEHAGTAETMATGVADLLTKDLFVQFWLGVYIHFIIGILGMLGMVAFRAWFFMGAAYNRAMATITVAISLRLLSAINRGVVVTEFGQGPFGANFLYLIVHYLKITLLSSWKHRRIADLLSIILATVATGMFGTILLRKDNMHDDEEGETYD
jgi:hypothetical protein